MICLIQDEDTLFIKIVATDGDAYELVRSLQKDRKGRLVLLGMLEGGAIEEADVRRGLARWAAGNGWFRPGPSVLALLCESPDVEELDHE
jgi:hypothetical protein